MRKVMAACLLCLAALTAAVPAAGAAGGGEGWSGDALLTPGIFTIDGSYTEDGMNAPYEKGYAPSVEDGKLTVVLPLNADSVIDGDVIYCGLDLGSRENNPFLYQNYQSIPVRLKYPDAESPDYDPSLYVAKFVLPLDEDRRNGVYPLGVAIRFRAGGKEQEQRFTINFMVSDGTGPAPDPSEEPGGDPGADDPGYSGPGSSGSGYDDPGVSDPGFVGGSGGGGGTGSDSTAPPSEPKVILQSAVAAPDPAPAGSPFTVTCTLRNTSKKQRVGNMTVSYKSQTTDLIPLGGANTQYIESIGADSTVQFAFQMESRLDAQSGPQKIDLSLGYEGSDGAAYTATDEITVQIQQAVRLEYDQPSFPSMVYIGDSMNTTLNLFNKGKGTLYNVTVQLDVPGIEPESSSFIGNMESGSSKSADIYANVVGLDAGDSSGPDGSDGDGDPEETSPDAAGLLAKAAGADESAALTDEAADFSVDSVDSSAGTGETSGEFLVTYEDEFGTVGELHIPVSTEIAQMEFYDEPMMEPEEPEPDEGFPWWGWGLVGGAGAAAAIPLVRHQRKKRAAALAAEMDDDELL